MQPAKARRAPAAADPSQNRERDKGQAAALGASFSKPGMTTEDPELADRFNRVLSETVEAMEESGLRYAFIGGIASGGLGRPRSTRDIDLFVSPEDAELALRALTRKGFATEKTDPSWLYKGFKDDILVDVIFKSKGEIYLDGEMRRRTITAEFHGKKLRLVAPEDLLIIKAVAHSELTPNHWHDAIGILSHATLDWDYLIWRARRAPRRVLSLLLYAQSNDVWVPNWVIHELYGSVFGDTLERVPGRPGGFRAAQARSAEPARQQQLPQSGTPVPALPKEEQPAQPLEHLPRPDHWPGEDERVQHPQHLQSAQRAYAVAHLREALAEDARTHELDIQIELAEDKVLLRGEVTEPGRRSAVEGIAREYFPDLTIENQIRVLQIGDSSDIEEVK